MSAGPSAKLSSTTEPIPKSPQPAPQNKAPNDDDDEEDRLKVEIEHLRAVNAELQKTLDAKHVVARAKRKETITGTEDHPLVVEASKKHNAILKEVKAAEATLENVAPFKNLCELDEEEDAPLSLSHDIVDRIKRHVPLADEIDSLLEEEKRLLANGVEMDAEFEQIEAEIDELQKSILIERQNTKETREDLFDDLDDVLEQELANDPGARDRIEDIHELESALDLLDEAMQRDYLNTHPNKVTKDDEADFAEHSQKAEMALAHSKSRAAWAKLLKSIDKDSTDAAKDVAMLSLAERCRYYSIRCKREIVGAIDTQQRASESITRACIAHFVTEARRMGNIAHLRKSYAVQSSFIDECKEEEYALIQSVIDEQEEQGRKVLQMLRQDLESAVQKHLYEENQKLIEIRETLAKSYAREMAPTMKGISDGIETCAKKTINLKEHLKSLEIRLAQVLEAYERDRDAAADFVSDEAERIREWKEEREEGLQRLRVCRLELRQGSAKLGVKSDEIVIFLKDCLLAWEENAKRPNSEAEMASLKMVLDAELQEDSRTVLTKSTL